MTRLHSDWKILEAIGPVERPHVVIDAGAHEGWFFHCWKDWCSQAEIHAFEPAIEAFERAKSLYGSDPSIHIINAGLGSALGTLEFSVLESSRVSNSFLQPVESTWKEIDYHTGAISKRIVEVTTLDDYAKEIASIYLLKIDVQGFELEVLKGAIETLKKTDHIFVEAGIRPLYQGAPRFTDVYDFLADRGFHLMAMRAWHRGNRVLVETDMLFRRDELMPPTSSEVERVVEQI